MTRPSSDILFAGLSNSTQHLDRIFLDLLWKFVWLVLTAVMIAVAAMWIIGEIGSAPLQGPELDAARPIILISMIDRLRNTYSTVVLGALAAVLLGATTLWLLLEAVFRGGWKNFRLYFASAAARTIILATLTALLATIVAQDQTPEVAILAAIIMLGVWFLVTTLETLIRTDTVELMGMEFGTVMSVMGCLFAAELLLAVVLWGLAAAVLLTVSGPPELLGALGLVIVVLVLWTVLHSYLLNVRSSTVHIMRRNSVDG